MQPQPNPTPPAAPIKKATFGFILSLLSGIIVLIRGIAWIAVGEMDFLGINEVSHRILRGAIAWHIGVVAIFFAIVIIIGAILIYMPGQEMIGGIIVLVFALLSIITGGGFLIGLILGVIGGILGMMKK